MRKTAPQAYKGVFPHSLILKGLPPINSSVLTKPGQGTNGSPRPELGISFFIYCWIRMANTLGWEVGVAIEG